MNLFAICTKNDESGTNTIIENIRSINTHHPEGHVVVVDSCSKDKSYISILQELKLDIKIYIEDISNINYEYGSILYAYHKYGNIFDKFIFLQDSIHLTDKLPQIENLIDNSVFVFGDHTANGCDGCETIMDMTNSLFSNDTPITIWNSFCINKKTFDIAINSEIFKNIRPPICKNGSRGWERAWSIVWKYNNIKIIIDKSGISKKFFNRQ